MNIEEALGVLDRVLEHRGLSDVQELIFRQVLEGKTYAEIAELAGYDANYIKDTGAKLWKLLSETLGEKVNKGNIQTVLRRCSQQPDRHGSTVQMGEMGGVKPGALEPGVLELENAQLIATRPALAVNSPASAKSDWGEALDTSIFHGRTAELTTLKQWVLEDRCRLIALLGMGGIGKTALSVKLAEEIQADFEFVIWRSLRNAPPLEALLSDIIQFLSQQQDIAASLPLDLSERIGRLAHYLRQSRCLIILDNAETLLRSGERSGVYREGYEGYGDLVQLFGETRHQSCLIITSREQLKEILMLECQESLVRALVLKGLGESAGQAILQQRGAFSASQPEWQRLVSHYAGNPLALRMVASILDEVFGGSIPEFLDYLQNSKNGFIFDDIRDLLERQFNRLSEQEQEVMYWLAINREFVTLSELRDDLVAVAAKRQLPETLRSLRRRSLIETVTLPRATTQAASFSQQPVVMEYLTEKLITEIAQEIATGEISGLMRYALLKVTAKDYIRDSQMRVIVEPILERLSVHLNVKPIFEPLNTSVPETVQSLLNQVLETLRSQWMNVPGYGAGNLINLLRRVRTSLSDYDFSGLAVWQANLQNLMLHGVSFENADLSRSCFSETLGGVLRIAFSADGQWLALGDSNGEISLRQVEDGELLLSWRGHEGVMCGIAFSPNGQLLASASRHIVKLWQVKQFSELSVPEDGVAEADRASAPQRVGKLLKTWTEHTGWIRQLAFSPDGQLLATVGNEDQTLRLWDIQTRACRYTFTGHQGAVLSCAFHPFQPIVASGSSDQTIKFWHTTTGTCLQTLVGQTNHIWSLAFSPDGQLLASGDGGGTIQLWRPTTGNCDATLRGHIGLIYSLSISPDGQTLASCASDATVRIWDLQSGQCLRVLQEHTNDVFDVGFQPDGQTLVSGGFDHMVKFWDTQHWHCHRTWRGYSNGFCSVAELPEQQLLTGSSDGYVRVWDLATGICLRKLPAHQGFAWSVAVSPSHDWPTEDWPARDWPSGDWFISAGEDALIKLWDLRTGKCAKVLRGHLSAIQAVAFCGPTSVKGNSGKPEVFLASVSSDGTVKLWDLATGECLRTWEGHRSRVWGLAVHPNGQMLASGSFDHTVRIWQLERDDCVAILSEHSHWVWGVAFSPDGSRLATASGDHTIKIWDTQTWCCLQTLNGHTSWVQSVGFSADGHYLVSGSVDTTVRVWDLQTWDCLQTLCGHTNWIYSVQFAIDGQTIISSCQDETLRIWDPQTGACLQTLRTDRLYEGMNLTGATGLTPSQKWMLHRLGALSS